MLSPLPRHSGWAHYFAHSPCRISLPRYGSRVGLCIVLFEACSAFTRVTACTLAPSPIRDALSEGFSHFVTSIAAPVASGWSVCRVGLAPTGKRRLSTAHANNRLPLVAADCHLLFASGFPTSRAQLTNSFATGLRSRFFSVTRPIGLNVSGMSRDNLDETGATIWVRRGGRVK